MIAFIPKATENTGMLHAHAASTVPKPPQATTAATALQSLCRQQQQRSMK
jgi:hypothetical protein